MVHFIFFCLAIAGGLIVLTAFLRYWTKHLSLRIFNVMTIGGEILVLPLTIKNLLDERNTPNTLALVIILIVIFLSVIWFVTQETTKKSNTTQKK